MSTARLQLTDCKYACSACNASFWSTLCTAIKCRTCSTAVMPTAETVHGSHVRGTFRCPCGNQWTHEFPLSRRCITGCGGLASPVTRVHTAAVAAECCGRVCWDLSGRIGSPVRCRLCDNHTPATRLIGDNHRNWLSGLFFELGRDAFNVRLADVGRIHVLPLAMSAPQRQRPRQPAAPTPIPANPYDLLATAAD